MATITITIPADQEQRVQDAFTALLTRSSDRDNPFVPPATLTDVKDWIIRDLKQLVRSVEYEAAQKTARENLSAEPDLT
jgi:hypothetical protein